MSFQLFHLMIEMTLCRWLMTIFQTTAIRIPLSLFADIALLSTTVLGLQDRLAADRLGLQVSTDKAIVVYRLWITQPDRRGGT